MKTILLIGVGRYGKLVALQLRELGHQVMAVDRREERINDILPYVTEARIGDSTNPEFLASLGIRNYDLCVVTVEDDFQSSLETTSLLKELGARYVVSRAARDVQEKFLLRNGADEVVFPDKQSAKWLAIRYTADHIHDYIPLDDAHAIFEVSVPAGIDNGQTISLRGQGSCGRNGGPNGDLLVTIMVRPHEIFRREGTSVLCEAPITFIQATLGAELEIPTIDGKVKYHIPEGTQSGSTFRLKGKGIPSINGRGRGDQYVTVYIETPRNLTKEQKEALKAFAATMGENNYEQRSRFFKKFKK